MRTTEEILDRIKRTDKILEKGRKEIDKLKLKNLMNATKEEKRKLFFEDVLPLFVAVNILTDRKATLMWALGEIELAVELNILSRISFDMIKENLELFDKQFYHQQLLL